MPPEEACGAERALHAALMAEPLAHADPAALADPDARENWGVFLRFRDRVAAEPTLEAAWLRLFREGVSGIPPLFLQMLTHLVARAALEGERDAFALRAGELLFRPQRAAITQGATLLADEEVVERRAAEADLGPLGRLLTEAGAPPREAEFDVLSEATAALYRPRSDAHDFALDIAEGRPGQAGIARALERFIAHVVGERVVIRPVPVIEDHNWTWHVGLDAEATRIVNALWANALGPNTLGPNTLGPNTLGPNTLGPNTLGAKALAKGQRVAQADLARILWLGVLEFEDASRVLPRAQGRPVYLVLAMDAAQRVRAKAQNLATNLPLLSPEQAA